MRASRRLPSSACGEAFLYNDAIVGIRGDTERLRTIEGALLDARAANGGDAPVEQDAGG